MKAAETSNYKAKRAVFKLNTPAATFARDTKQKEKAAAMVATDAKKEAKKEAKVKVDGARAVGKVARENKQKDKRAAKVEAEAKRGAKVKAKAEDKEKADWAKVKAKAEVKVKADEAKKAKAELVDAKVEVHTEVPRPPLPLHLLCCFSRSHLYVMRGGLLFF